MKKGVVVFSTLVVFLLAACTPAQEFDVGTYQPSGFSKKDVPSRPVVNKTAYDFEDEVDEPAKPNIPNIPNNPERKPVPQLSTPIEEYQLSVGYGLLGINETLGKYSDSFTKYEFPELLKSRNIRSGVEPVAASYEQFLKLKGGRVVFTANEEGIVGDYLVYRDEEPVFEYEFVLGQGTFLDFIGEEILFLGHLYVIADATKEDIVLEGVDNSNQLVIGGGSVLVNGRKLTNTDSEMTGSTFTFISKADSARGDDIFISPGHSLQEYLGNPTLLTDRFDVRYRGILEVPHTSVDFESRGDEIELSITDPYRELFIPLAYKTENGFRLGDEEGKLHIIEASGEDDFKIKQNDYFLLTSSRLSPTILNYRRRNEDDSRLSIALQYKGADGDSIELASPGGFTTRAYYNRTQSGDGEGRINFAGSTYDFQVGPRTQGYPIAVDMNGDGRISGGILDYYFPDGVIDLPSKEEFTSPASITFKFLNFEGLGMRTEEANFQINPGSELSLSFLTDRDLFSMGSDDKVTVSTFGTHYFLFNEVDDDKYEEASIEHPLEKRLAEIVVEAR